MNLHEAALTRHQTRAVRAIDRYWRRLAAGGVIPRRSQIDPRAIQDALDHAFIAERIAGGQARFRVAGGSVGMVLGMEIAGMPLAALIRPDMRDSFAADLARLFETPATLAMGLSSPATSGRPALDARLRLYPLRGPAGTVSQMLGSFVTTGTIGRAPRRFGLDTVEASPVTILPQGRGYLKLVVSND